MNAQAWAGSTSAFEVQKSLDSSLKKNTAFIKRVRTSISGSTPAVFLQEIRSLSLEKYLSEIISACYEGLCKLKTPVEIATGVEIVSGLHQRFGPDAFTKYLAWNIGKGLSTPDKAHLKSLSQDVRDREEKDRLARQRILLKVATELWLVGVLRSLEDIDKPEEVGKTKDSVKAADLVLKTKPQPVLSKSEPGQAEPFPLEVLKDLLGHDRDHVNLPLVVLFIKSFAWDILGVRLASVEGRKAVQEDGTTTTTNRPTDGTSTEEEEYLVEDPPITPPELRQLFRNIISRYFDDVKQHIIRDQKALVAQGRRNAEAYVRSGEVFEDRQANFEKQSKAQERLVANAQVIADALSLEMPDLKEKDSTAAMSEGAVGLVNTGEYLRGHGEGPGIWEDEEERRFYENLIDLKDRVPGILLEDGKKKKGDNDDQVGRKVTEESSDAASANTEQKSEDDQSTAIANKSVGAQVDALLARLPDLTNKDMVDECAIDFCFLNSKASRNRLLKSLQEIPKGRSDLLPFYGRVVATLGKYLTDISQGMVSYLDEEFRSLQRRKSKESLGQVRLQNIRYLAELTKFGVVPEHVIFHCFKVCLDDFSRLNIEIMSNLLENCGRFLLRNPETSPRMVSFLDTVQRKKAAQHLGQQERMLIENAVYFVNPPERAAIEQKERSPVEQYIRKIMYLDLNKKTLDKIVKQVRKLHWEDAEVNLLSSYASVCTNRVDQVVDVLQKIFTKPAKIKYSNIHLLAVILGSLNRYHQSFTITVIDNLLESITLGLEINDFKFNQRRIVEVKYLAELYIYRMVDSPLIFDVLYRILTYGHEGGVPKAGAINSLDLPDDYFRIRLICNLLESCGVFFDKGQAKKKLDFFLTFFQYYIQTKDPLPMDTDFLVQEAFATVRPNWKLITNLEEAGKLFADACKENYQSNGADRNADMEEPEDELPSDGDDDELTVRDRPGEKSEDETGDGEPDEGLNGVHSESEEEHIVVTRPEDQRDPEADAEFDREFAKMMAESLDSRKFDRKPVFDVPLPIRKAQRDTATPADELPTEERPVTPYGPGIMKFSLLSKRGNRQQVRLGSHALLALYTDRCLADSVHRSPSRFNLRCSYAHPASRRARGTTKDQEPGT